MSALGRTSRDVFRTDLGDPGRSAIEPLIGHLKSEGHLGRCYLKGRAGDAANVILSAVGHNLRRILAWPSNLLRLVLITLWRAFAIPAAYNPAY